MVINFRIIEYFVCRTGISFKNFAARMPTHLFTEEPHLVMSKDCYHICNFLKWKI